MSNHFTELDGTPAGVWVFVHRRDDGAISVSENSNKERMDLLTHVADEYDLSLSRLSGQRFGSGDVRVYIVCNVYTLNVRELQ